MSGSTILLSFTESLFLFVSRPSSFYFSPMNDAMIFERARRCLQFEIDAVQATSESLDASFTGLVRHLHHVAQAGHKVLFSGVGKSAHIAAKLAGTFNSIGVRSVFLDPVQALHGDLGLCMEGDTSLLLSNSGQSEEILRLAPILQRLGVPVNAITGSGPNPLAQISQFRVCTIVPREACPLRLAPTASTTAALAMGDALAMVLLEMQGVTKETFARVHPAGQLGLSLLLKVKDIMRTDQRFACANRTDQVKDAILAMTKAKSGALAVVDPGDGTLFGIFTDGDFRRALVKDSRALEQPVGEFTSRHPITISVNAMATAAIRLFEQHHIDDLIVIDEQNRAVGLIDNQDLPKLRVF